MADAEEVQWGRAYRNGEAFTLSHTHSYTICTRCYSSIWAPREVVMTHDCETDFWTPTATDAAEA